MSDAAGSPVDDRVVEAARTGDVTALAALLDVFRQAPRGTEPYNSRCCTWRRLPDIWKWWTCCSDAAWIDTEKATQKNANALGRGSREEVVRRLADAGGDVVGHGDDHALDVIGWASCWDGCDDTFHRAVVGPSPQSRCEHHIFSAIALNLPRLSALVET